MSISWQIVTVEGVGQLTRPSLAFSPSGQPAIAFYSSWKQALRLATLNNVGTWTIGDVDKVSDDCFPSLASGSGVPRLAMASSPLKNSDTPTSEDGMFPGQLSLSHREGVPAHLRSTAPSGRVSATMSRTAKRSDTLKVQRLPPGPASPWRRIQIAASSIHSPSPQPSGPTRHPTGRAHGNAYPRRGVEILCLLRRYHY
jgi:hypothetical protein